MSVALTAIDELKSKGFAISGESVEAGLAAARWPGRMQLIARHPKVIIDGAHNTLAVEAFSTAFSQLVRGKRPHIVFSSISGKPVDEMAKILVSIAELIHIAPLQFPKGLPTDTLKSAVEKAGGKYIIYTDVPSAMDGAKRSAGVDGVVVVTGSLYLVGEVMRHYRGLSLSSPNGGIDDSI